MQLQPLALRWWPCLWLWVLRASNVPPMTGVTAAINGGIVTTSFRGSHMAINGPAAGLIAVILSSLGNPGFSDNFVVKVDDEAGMDVFLTDELKQFFKSSNIDHIERSGQAILISPDQFRLAPIHEYSRIIKMLDKLRTLVAKLD